MKDLTQESLKLFDSLVADAPNWNGDPLVTVSKEQCGNLTQLKRHGLLETVKEDNATFAIFTDKGKQLASQRDNIRDEKLAPKVP